VIRLIAAVALLLLSVSSTARPISYTGGLTLIEESDRQSTSVLVHFTPAHQWSIGVRGEHNRDQAYALYTLHPTWLARRWFGKNHQGNLYLHGGVGIATGVDGNPLGDDIAAHGGVMADWETRSLFASYRSRYLDAGHFGAQFVHAARAGFAPYIGKTGDLHTWLMLEIDHRPSERTSMTATPLIRFFKGPVLLELGYTLSINQPLINFTYRL
jgi:hypothetical protein